MGDSEPMKLGMPKTEMKNIAFDGIRIRMRAVKIIHLL